VPQALTSPPPIQRVNPYFHLPFEISTLPPLAVDDSHAAQCAALSAPYHASPDGSAHNPYAPACPYRRELDAPNNAAAYQLKAAQCAALIAPYYAAIL
jgi:hypothetical protein